MIYTHIVCIYIILYIYVYLSLSLSLYIYIYKGRVYNSRNGVELSKHMVFQMKVWNYYGGAFGNCRCRSS